MTWLEKQTTATVNEAATSFEYRLQRFAAQEFRVLSSLDEITYAAINRSQSHKFAHCDISKRDKVTIQKRSATPN